MNSDIVSRAAVPIVILLKYRNIGCFLKVDQNLDKREKVL